MKRIEDVSCILVFDDDMNLVGMEDKD